MFTNHFGIEMEFTGITRAQAAEVTAKYLGGTVTQAGGYYDTYHVTAPDGRVWKFMSDASIDCQRKSGRRTVHADTSYSVELVSPILLYREDIDTVGKSLLRGWRLMFRGGSHSAVATVERMPGHTVPVLIWRLQPSDEQALDVYEGWPRLYRKETIRLTINGRRVYAMIYIMNEQGHPYGKPSSFYLNTICEGYHSCRFDPEILLTAVADSRKEAL